MLLQMALKTLNFGGCATNSQIPYISHTPYLKKSTVNLLNHEKMSGWLGWAMVLGSFQCQGVILLLHIVGQGPAGALYFFYIFFIYLPFLMSCLLGDG